MTDHISKLVFMFVIDVIQNANTYLDK
jgi:hypothetical protein